MTTEKQAEALRLADLLEKAEWTSAVHRSCGAGLSSTTRIFGSYIPKEAAAELRRLQAEVERLEMERDHAQDCFEAAKQELERLSKPGYVWVPEANEKDTERLDWIARQADDFTSYILQDCPGDGNYFVAGMESTGEAPTFREAVDRAMIAEAKEPAYPPDDGPLTDKQIAAIRSAANKEQS